MSVRSRRPSATIFRSTLSIGVFASMFAGAVDAATHQVNLSGFSYTPSTLTIQVGDTVRWVNQNGVHDVVSDDNLFTSGSPAGPGWSYSFTFTSPGQFDYYCSLHGGPGGNGMSGRINVEGTASTTPRISEGVAGTWFNAATPGQGFLVEVNPQAGLFVVGWFTWSGTPGDYDWLSGAGTYSGNRADVVWNRSRGGTFNAATPVTTTAAGTGVFTFETCSRATLQFNLTDPAASGTITLDKLLPASPLCTSTAPLAPAK